MCVCVCVRACVCACVRAGEQVPDYKVVVFFTTARLTQLYAELFGGMGVRVLEIHSRKSQSQRNKVSDLFREQVSRLLPAPVACRVASHVSRRATFSRKIERVNGYLLSRNCSWKRKRRSND